jgi:flavin reductase (DIM6/NTAB) family NADH-FMN oxidoreductase RutF
MIIDTTAVTKRDRYQLATSLVVPRPIGWISTRSAGGVANVAPFSYFCVISATPLLVAVSIGSRGGAPKDTLANARARGGFCVNVVTERQLAVMNATSGEYDAGVSEFDEVALPVGEAESVDAPYVADCPAVLECRVMREVALDGSANTLVIGEVLRVRVADEVGFVPGTRFVDTARLRPVGRLWGERYALIGETPALPRPGAPEG